MSSGANPKHVRLAAEVAKKLASIECTRATTSDKGDEGREKKPGLVRRAQEFPNLMLSFGFFPAFTFYLSKLEAEDYKRLGNMLKFLRGTSDDGAEFCKELEPSEGSGYAGYVAILIRVLQDINKIGDDFEIKEDRQNTGESKEKKEKFVYASAFKALIESAEKVTFRDQWAISLYVNEVKKVLEAMPV